MPATMNGPMMPRANHSSKTTAAASTARRTVWSDQPNSKPWDDVTLGGWLDPVLPVIGAPQSARLALAPPPRRRCLSFPSRATRIAYLAAVFRGSVAGGDAAARGRRQHGPESRVGPDLQT